MEHQTENCAEGYSGTLCGTCLDGYWQLPSDLSCTECPSGAGSFFVALYKAVLLPLAIISLALFFINVNVDYGEGRYSLLPAFFKILIAHIGMVLLLYNEMSQNADLYEITLAIQNFTMLTSYDELFCLIGMDGPNNMYKSLLPLTMPFVMAGITAAFVWVYLRVKKLPAEFFKPLLVQVLILVYLMTFYDVMYRLTTLIRCRERDDVSFSYLIVDEACYSADQSIAVVAVALPYFIGYFILLPLFFWRTIRKPENKQPLFTILKYKWTTENFSRQQAADVKRFQMTYGITFIGLRQATYYWDMIVVMKFFIVMFTLSLVQTAIVELR